MHVVLLNQPFHPDVVATAQMGKDLADALVARGHRVSAVASRSIYGRAGAQLPKRETIDGIEIHRVGASIFGRRGLLARAADFALFYVLAAARLLTMKKPDVVVGFTTPPFIALLGILCRVLRGARAVYWVMDLYPDVPVASGVFRARSPLTRVCEFFAGLLLRRSDATVVLGRCMKVRVLAKGAPAERVHYIPVWSDDAKVTPVEHGENPYRREWGLEGRFVVMYSGNFGLAHDSAAILETIRRLRDEPVTFLFVGAGARKAEVLALMEREGLGNVQWRDYVPRERLALSLSAADAHLISLARGMEGLIVPSKMFGILAVARPALFIGSPESELGRIVQESECGFVIAPGDADALTGAINRLRADADLARRMGESGRRALLGRYDRASACARWVELLESLRPDRR